MSTTNKIKCLKHNDKDIVLLCVSCSTPICLDCIDSGDHLNHLNNKINYFNKENVYPILKEFELKNYGYLKSYKKSNEMIQNSSDICYNQLKPIEINKSIVNNHFKLIHNRLINLKIDLLNTLYNTNYIKLNIKLNDNKIKRISNQIKSISYISIRSDLIKDEYNRLMINKLFKHPINNTILYYSNGELSRYNKIILDMEIPQLYLQDNIDELYLINKGVVYKECIQFRPLRFTNRITKNLYFNSLIYKFIRIDNIIIVRQDKY